MIMDKIEKAVEKFQKKFSSISVIKNDISGNMYESISDWLRQALLTAHKQGKKDRDEEVLEWTSKLKWNDVDLIRIEDLKTFINQNNEK